DAPPPGFGRPRRLDLVDEGPQGPEELAQQRLLLRRRRPLGIDGDGRLQPRQADAGGYRGRPAARDQIHLVLVFGNPLEVPAADPLHLLLADRAVAQVAGTDPVAPFPAAE